MVFIPQEDKRQKALSLQAAEKHSTEAVINIQT